LIQRADSLREVARMTSIQLPYKLANELEARDAQRRVAHKAEERARELIAEQVDAFRRAEGDFSKSCAARCAMTGPT
ncbi:MAG: hypothetical protein Q8N33_07960, partial [Rhodocyclaceae bacterium]|nr:hypothetical protein [Rhodocyclaceae bacterium]